MPLQHVARAMVILLIVWIAMEWLIRTKLQKYLWWKLCNILMMFGILVVIFVATLSSRSNVSDVCWLPFYSFKLAKIQPEIYRSMLMNVFLFFPLGLTMPYVLPKKWKHNVLIAILFGLILSIAIEFLQYYFCLGRAETDDVICNTLGCAIGTIAFRLNRTSKRNSNSN